MKNIFLNLPFIQSIVCGKFDEMDDEVNNFIHNILHHDDDDDDVYIFLLKKARRMPPRNQLKQLFLSKTALLIRDYNDIVKTRRYCDKLNDIVREYVSIVKELAIKYNWIDLLAKLEGTPTNASSSSHVNDAAGADICHNCRGTQFLIDEENKRKTCASCYNQTKLMETGHTHQDYNRVNIIGKFVYNRVVHFQDCIKQFQGKQNCKIPQEVYAKLDAKFKSLRLLVESDNYHIRYAKITPEIIKILLKELKLSKHYENVNVIYYALTNKRVADISELEERLVDDFKELLNLYDNKYLKENNGIDRKNFMNVQYILFQLLRKHGYPCSIQDFSVLKTADRKLFHDNICGQLFKQLGWNFTPTF